MYSEARDKKLLGNLVSLAGTAKKVDFKRL